MYGRDSRHPASHSPPETISVSPVIQRPSSDARKTTGGPMSSGCPMRPRGVNSTLCFSIGLSAKPPEMKPSVITTPGFTEFTRILRGPSSFARDFVIASTAALLAAETEEPAGATVLTRDPMFTTLPPVSGNNGSAAWVVSRRPSTLRSNSRCHAFAVTDSRGPKA